MATSEETSLTETSSSSSSSSSTISISPSSVDPSSLPSTSVTASPPTPSKQFEPPAVVAGPALTPGSSFLDTEAPVPISSNRQFQSLWADHGARARWLQFVRTSSLRGCPQAYSRFVAELDGLLSSNPPALDTDVHQRMYALVHDDIMKSSEYKIAFPDRADLQARDEEQADKRDRVQQQLLSRAKRRVSQLTSVLPEREITSRTNPKYLDVGCSEGSITASMALALGIPPENAFGTDIRDVKTREGFNFVLVSEDDPTLPFDSESFDLITLNMSLHHIGQPKDLLCEVARVLKADGWVVVREHDVCASDVALLVDTLHALYNNVVGWKRELETATNLRCVADDSRKVPSLAEQRVAALNDQNVINPFRHFHAAFRLKDAARSTSRLPSNSYRGRGGFGAPRWEDRRSSEGRRDDGGRWEDPRSSEGRRDDGGRWESRRSSEGRHDGGRWHDRNRSSSSNYSRGSARYGYDDDSRDHVSRSDRYRDDDSYARRGSERDSRSDYGRDRERDRGDHHNESRSRQNESSRGSSERGWR